MSKSLLDKHAKAKAFADRWINILRDEGYSYDEMLVVFRLASKKMQYYLRKENEKVAE